ncbi:MAG: carbohydrate kinase [Phycisphaeraceae bacterium]
MQSRRTIVGIGEALFDVFDDEQRLGGAPLNVAVHAHQLGNNGVVVSRVGQDELGRRIAEELTQRSMDTALLQTDPDRPTGTVRVDLSVEGDPQYDILPGVAWDVVQYDFDVEDLAQRCHAVCFGTLAQRDGQTRNTIYRFLEASRRAIRLFDVNLRQNYYDRRILNRSLESATAVKLNTAELRKLDELFQLGGSFDAAAQTLMERHPNLGWVALTRGTEGTVVFTPGERHESAPVVAKVTDKADAVGAGDATTAALLHGALRRWPWERTLELANELGAYVASQPGACPPLNDHLKKLAQLEA